MANNLRRLLTGKKEYLILFLSFGIVSLLKLFLIGDHIQRKIIISNTLDFSWKSDMTERFLHDFLAGRDFIFTYGPLYQILTSLPSSLFGNSSYTSVLLSPFIFLFLSFLIFIFITKQLKINRSGQAVLGILFIFIFGLSSIIDPNDLLRQLFPLLFGILFYRFLYLQKKLSMKSFLILTIPAISGAYIFDLFISCVLIAAVFFVFKFVRKSDNLSSILKISFFSFFYILLSELVISFIISKNLSYFWDSLSTVSDYRFIMNIPISPGQNYIYFIFPLILFLFLIWSMRSKNKISKNNLLLVFCFVALLGVKNALIRTDTEHIISAIIPSVVALFVLAYFLVEGKKKFAAIFSILVLGIFFKENYYQAVSAGALNSSIRLITNKISFFGIYQPSLNYYLSNEDFHYLSKLILQNPGKVMVYPYDTYLLNIHNQTYNTFALQFYDFSNSSVEQKTVDKLAKNPPKLIIFGIDDTGVPRLDNIPNISRNSIFTKWVINNYSVYENRKSYLILKYDPTNKEYKNKDCKLFSLNSKKIKKNFLVDVVKPSTYYINNDEYIRIPVTKISNEILFFADYSDTDSLERLINSNVNFSKFNLVKPNFKILKKYPLPILNEESSDFYINCYL